MFCVWVREDAEADCCPHLEEEGSCKEKKINSDKRTIDVCMDLTGIVDLTKTEVKLPFFFSSC